MTMAIAHDLAQQRFSTLVDGHTAVLDYLRDGPVVQMVHVGVPPPIEGRGIAGALTKAALDWARGESLPVEARCPYVAGWIGRHPEYQDLLLDDGARGAGSVPPA